MDSLQSVAVKGAVISRTLLSYQNWKVLKLRMCREILYLLFQGPIIRWVRVAHGLRVPVIRGWVSGFETEFRSAKIEKTNQVPVFENWASACGLLMRSYSTNNKQFYCRRLTKLAKERKVDKCISYMCWPNRSARWIRWNISKSYCNEKKTSFSIETVLEPRRFNPK